MGQKHPETLRERQRYFNGIADEITDKLEAKGALVIVQDQNGVLGLSCHGINHAEAVNLLASAIHMVLGEHDKAVLAGAAGEEAQKRAVEIAAQNEEAA